MSTLLSYSDPPVVETAVSLQFRPLEKFRNVNLWEFWSEIRDIYPKTQDQEPLDQRIGQFGKEGQPGLRLPRFQFRPHASRLQAISEDERRVVQIQNGRFVFNWRRKDQEDEYPRWPKISGEFWDWFEKFTRHVDGKQLGLITLNQWEVTYVNHLMGARDWQTEAEWPVLLPGMLGDCNAVSAGRLDGVDCNVQFAMKEGKGRLHLDLKKAALASEPDRELLVLSLTARGPIDENSAARDCLEKGREAIVTAFGEITGQEAQVRWGREQQ